MNLDPEVGKRYGLALFETAKRQGVVDQLIEDAERMAPMLRPGSNFRRFLEGPQFTTQEQTALVEKAFRGKYNDLLVNLLGLLIKRRRVFYTRMIYQEFVRLVEESRGIYPAEIISAVEIDNAQKHALAASLQQYTEHQLRIDYLVDPRLIGGVIFKYRDLLIDDSVKTRLDKIRSKLMARRVVTMPG